MSKCSVVMVTYHSGPVLYGSVKTVLKQQALAELIIVDNGNPPDVLARLQQMALGQPRLKIITGHGNIGFSRGCNLGAKQATGDFILLLNPDCLLPPDALTNTMRGFDEIPNARLAGCWLVNPDGSEQRGGRRQLLTPKIALSEALGIHKWLRMKRLNDHTTEMSRETHEVPAISGAFMCMRKSDFDRMDGLDEAFFLHVEDLDMCIRVYRAGGRVICVPRVKVTHMLSTSGESTSRFIEWQKAKGFIRYFKKHFAGEHFPGLLLLLDAAILARFFLKVTVSAFWNKARRKPLMHHTVPAKRLMILASGLADLPETKELEEATVMVTGATGQTGLCVLRRLLASGASVLALSRADAIPFAHENLRWIKGDLTDEALHLQGYLIDALIHCAPIEQLPATINMLAAAEVQRIIAFGSTSIVAKAMSDNAYEKDLVKRLTVAEAGIAENCNAKDIYWTIFRPTMIYGVGLDLNVTTLIKFIDRWGIFPVYPPAVGRRQPVHADDLALAAMQALQNETSYGKSYNLSGGEIVTFRQLIERLFALCGKKARIIESTLLPFALDVLGRLVNKKHINGEIARRMNDDLIFFHDDASRDFGFHPRAFLSGGIKDIEGF